MIDISIILPSIRPKNLEKFYESAIKSCGSVRFEIIIPSPYLIPESLMKKWNVTFLHTYSSPTVAFQKAALLSSGRFIYNTTDDGLLLENAIKEAVQMFDSPSDRYRQLGHKDIINMRYIEDVLDPNTLEYIKSPVPFPDYYWAASTYPEYRKPSINPAWRLAPHFLMSTKYFLELGGLDCNFEYLNFPLHDLIFRAQANGSVVFDSLSIAYHCSHLPNKTGDHGPIHEAHFENDVPKFEEIYNDPLAVNKRINIYYNNWRYQPRIWSRRFKEKDLPIHPNA